MIALFLGGVWNSIFPWRRFGAYSAIFIMVGWSACCRADIIPATNHTGMVHDSTRNMLYIAAGSSVLRYDLSKKSFASPVQTSGSLSGIDLSPDGNTLAVASQSSSATNIWMYLIDVPTLTVKQVGFERQAEELGTYSVAWGSDGALLVASMAFSSNALPLRRYDPATGNTKVVGTVYAFSLLSPSSDRTSIAVCENYFYTSPPLVCLYDTASQTLASSVVPPAGGFDVALNHDGTKLAVTTAQGLIMYDLQRQTNVSLASGAEGVAFHPRKNGVFVPWGGTHQVRLLDANDLSCIGCLTNSSTVFTTPGSAGQLQSQHLCLSQDGNLVFVFVNSGVEYFTNTFTINEYCKLAISGAPTNFGTAYPMDYGSNVLIRYSQITNTVASSVEQSDTRYSPVGFTLSGASAIASSSNQVSFILSNDTTLVWNWRPSACQLKLTAYYLGTISTTGGWINYGAVTNISAIPNLGARFIRWIGDVDEADATSNPLALSMDRPRTITALFGLAADSAATSNPAEWPTFGNGPAHTGYVPISLANSTFNPRWQVSVGGNLQQAAIGMNRVFVTSSSGSQYMAAVDVNSGRLVWRYNFASCFSLNPPTYDSGSVLAQRCNNDSDTQLWSIDANTGAVRWSARLTSQWEHYFAPTVADGKIWVDGGSFGGLYGVDEATGTQLFYQGLEQYDQWTPAYANGRLFSWVEGNFREHDPNTGNTLWSTNLGWSWAGYDMNRDDGR